METVSLPDLRCFLAIADAGGITRAAKKLGLKKAAVSRSLARLEDALGVRVFERNTRRIAITRAGVLLRSRAESLLADVASLKSELRRDADEAHGSLTVAAPPDLGTSLTEGVFPSFLRDNPRVRLSLRLDYAYQDLFDPTIDLAFRIGAVMDESLHARPLWTFRRVLVASPRASLPKAPAELARTPCLLFDPTTFDASFTLTDGRTKKTVSVEGRFAANGYPAVLAAARTGAGVAFLPEFVVAPLLQRNELVRVLPQWSSPPITTFLVHRVGQSRVRRVRAFLDHVAGTRDLPQGLHRDGAA
jgi:LysR family transcriptional activator of dmlA